MAANSNKQVDALMIQMKVNITGEDGYTLYFVANESEKIKGDLGLENINRIWFRQSFGRSAGPKRKDDDKGYFGF